MSPPVQNSFIQRKRRAISLVKSTLLLTVLIVTLVYTIGFWTTGLLEFERVEIHTAYAEIISEHGWRVTLMLKNSGSTDASFKSLSINDASLNVTGYGFTSFPPDPNGNRVVTSLEPDTAILRSGEEATIRVWIYNDGFHKYSELSSKTSVNIKIQSSSGVEYAKMVELT